MKNKINGIFKVMLAMLLLIFLGVIFRQLYTLFAIDFFPGLVESGSINYKPNLFWFVGALFTVAYFNRKALKL